MCQCYTPVVTAAIITLLVSLCHHTLKKARADTHWHVFLWLWTIKLKAFYFFNPNWSAWTWIFSCLPHNLSVFPHSYVFVWIPQISSQEVVFWGGCHQQLWLNQNNSSWQKLGKSETLSASPIFTSNAELSRLFPTNSLSLVPLWSHAAL